MIYIARFLLLAQLWCISPVSSSEGLLRGSGGRDLADETEGISPKLHNSTDTVDINYHHRASRISAGQMEQRIIGGSSASANRYTYTVGIINKGGLFCGGVLISQDMVLTAAQCADGNDYLRFLIGSSNLSEGFANKAGEFVFAEKGWINTGYKWETMDNDAMIYKLERPVKADVEFITLNDDSRVPARAGSKLVALGWGDTDPGGTYKASDSLMKVGVDYIPNEACNKRTGSVGSDFFSFKNQIEDSMLCALDRGKDGCQNDSGGPLIIEGNDQRGQQDVLVGLSSWGVVCAHNTLPGVYTRVSTQYKWIKSIVCKNSRDPPASFKCVGGGKDKTTNGNSKKPNNKKSNNKKSNNKKSNNKKRSNKKSNNKKPSKKKKKKKKKKEKKPTGKME